MFRSAKKCQRHCEQDGKAVTLHENHNFQPQMLNIISQGALNVGFNINHVKRIAIQCRQGAIRPCFTTKSLGTLAGADVIAWPPPPPPKCTKVVNDASRVSLGDCAKVSKSQLLREHGLLPLRLLPRSRTHQQLSL